MRLAGLDREESFALLGPGFGGAPFRLLRGLSEGGGGGLVYAAFEAPGARPRCFAAAADGPCEVEWAGTASGLAVELDARGYAARVERIREAIARGDVYQVCYTLRARLAHANGAELLTALCARGVPRFAAWVRLPGGEEFVSGSPELFFETEGGRVRSEPMKGTARPDASGALAASEKDRCELAMITDLVRNDLTPVCRPRTVRVEHERRVLTLPYALQTVSDVAGDLLPIAGPLEVLAALHPGGSVTGAPKPAALAMIGELETGPRGAYCGALGVRDGDRSTFGLLIRTAVRGAGGWEYGVGSGVVYDSDAANELDELRVKLGALGCPIRCCE